MAINYPDSGYWIVIDRARGTKIYYEMVSYSHRHVRRSAERLLNKLGIKAIQQDKGNVYAAYYSEDGRYYLSHYFDPQHIIKDYDKGNIHSGFLDKDCPSYRPHWSENL